MGKATREVETTNRDRDDDHQEAALTTATTSGNGGSPSNDHDHDHHHDELLHIVQENQRSSEFFLKQKEKLARINSQGEEVVTGEEEEEHQKKGKPKAKEDDACILKFISDNEHQKQHEAAAASQRIILPPPPGAYRGAPGVDPRRTEKINFALVGNSSMGAASNIETGSSSLGMDAGVPGSALPSITGKTSTNPDVDEGKSPPLEIPELRVQQTIRPHDDTPGAVAVSMPSPDCRDRDGEEEAPERRPSAATSIATMDTSSLFEGLQDLAVADEVVDSSELPKAEEIDLEAGKQPTRKNCISKNHSSTLMITGLMVTNIITLVILLSVLLTGKDESNDASSAISSPTPAPLMTVEEEDEFNGILRLLPHDTQIAIQDGSSAQAKAYDWLLNDPNLQNYTNERILQRFALASLYVATNGDKWTRNTNWLSYSVHECEWYISPSFAMKDLLSVAYPGYMGGLDPPKRNCYQDEEEDGSPNNMSGKYQNLWLDQNELEGSLPKELYLLTTLKTLSIMYNKLEGSGSIPNQVGQLTNLEGLVLHGLQNMGSVATEIGLLTNLRGLILNRISGTVPSELQSLTNLEAIGLQRNPRLSGNILPFLTHYPKLSWLVIEGSNFTGTIPTVVGKLSALQMWAMNGNRGVHGTLPSQVGLLSNLEMLFIPETSMTGTLPIELGRLKSARMFGFRDNLFTGTIPSELGLATNLKSLMFETNRFSGTVPTEMGELTSLYRISFKNNELTGRIPSQLGSLASLGSLSLGNNPLMTGTIPDEVTSVMNPRLFSFDVGGNQLLSGTIPEALCRINGTCTPSPVMDCIHQNGLIFDCQSQLCGCGCPCGSIGNQSAILP